jgi:hypothetical protein
MESRGIRPASEQRDKAFLIARPIRKGSWARRFAAGWAEQGAGDARGELVEIGCSESAGCFCEELLTMRAAVTKPRSYVKNPAHDGAFVVSG